MAVVVNRYGEWRVAKFFYDVLFPGAAPWCDESADDTCYASFSDAVDSLR